MQRLPAMGSQGTRLIIEGRNAQDDIIATDSICGGPQADLTASVVTRLALALIHSSTELPPGLQPLGLFVDPDSIVGGL